LKHPASSRFWALYDALPEEVRAVADRNYLLLKSNPKHLLFISSDSASYGPSV